VPSDHFNFQPSPTHKWLLGWAWKKCLEPLNSFTNAQL